MEHICIKNIFIRRNQSEINETIDQNAKNFLTEADIKKFLEAARQGRHGMRD